MTADQLIQYLSWTVYVLIFLVAAVNAARRPRRASVDIALFFSAPLLIIGQGIGAALGLVRAGPIPNAISTSLLLSLGYLLLRLVDDFTIVPGWLVRGAAAGIGLLAACAFLFTPPRPEPLNLLMAAYLIGLLAYSAVAFFRASRRTSGVTRRRMRAVAAGGLLLVALFVMAVLRPYLPPNEDLWQMVSDAIGLASGVAFFVGFAPPSWLRRAWQEPELRAFLGRAASLPRLPDTAAIVGELEHGAATSIGASASIGLWDAERDVLSFTLLGRMVDLAPTAGLPSSQAFLRQEPTIGVDIRESPPPYTEMSRSYGMRTVLAAPITAGEKRLGVLSVFAPRAPIFAEDDLALVQLLADQAAVILESRALIDEAARVRAREEAARLKDDFLSAAAHDLKTPLTTLVARAQLLERRALRDPAAPADLLSIRLIVNEGQRLKRLVLELLDAARAERGHLVGERAPVDLVALAREAGARHQTERHDIQVEADGPLIGAYDQLRVAQLLENLTENAVKYSPEGGPVRIRVWRDGDEARIAVSDQGIGVPPDDLPHIFERFHRAANVDDRRFAGMGLGLFICRGIVEQHGGRIWATSRAGQGTTFHIALPLEPAGAPVYA